MATYDIPTQGIPSELHAGDILNAPYTGSRLTIALPAGDYKLECWGAGLGSYSKGGYSVGNLHLDTLTAMWLYCGGKGTLSTAEARGEGGFNGGGYCVRTSYAGTTTDGYGGCGATDIRINADNLNNRVIVAGGGPGYNTQATFNGYGGGLTGNPAIAYYSDSWPVNLPTSAACQTAPPSRDSFACEFSGGFGYGANQTGAGDKYSGGGGGGGWYGGHTSNHDQSKYIGAGGGSGFVYTKFAQVPSTYALDAKYMLTDATTIGGNQTIPSTSGKTESGHTTTGYIRITVLPLNKHTGEKAWYYKANEDDWIKLKRLNEGASYYGNL